jgi:RNA polymerase sigma-70 factor (ECF subfamily)
VYNTVESEEDLIRRVKNGDCEAFSPLVERYKLPLYKVMYRMVHNRDDAEDLVEEAFIRSYKAIARFETGRPFFSWICRIAVNNAINYLKKERRGHIQSVDEIQYSLAAKKGNPVEMTKQKMLEEKITAAMALLPANYRTILTLKIEQDFSYEEIGRILKIPKGTVMSRLSRARQKLKEIFTSLEVGTQ